MSAQHPRLAHPQRVMIQLCMTVSTSDINIYWCNYFKGVSELNAGTSVGVKPVRHLLTSFIDFVHLYMNIEFERYAIS